jgi:hypothetical protein
MDEDLIRELEAEFARLRVGSDEAQVEAIVGNPPWLYTPEHVLEVLRALPDGAGAAAIGRALRARRYLDGPSAP